MTYEAKFKPEELRTQRGRRPDRVAYLYDGDITLAVNVALVTNRPLLLSGDPGSGKSSIAADIAWLLNRRFEERVITSRLQGQDLKWRFDSVRRLADVQAIKPGQHVDLPDSRYVQPEILWRAFNREDASRYGAVVSNSPIDTRPEVVVLIDEIDKADPDLPNDLLVALDEKRFVVEDIGHEVTASSDLKLLVVITTNGERDLPPAFVRRCVTYRIPSPEKKRLKAIGLEHFPEAKEEFLDEVSDTLDTIAANAAKERRRAPSVAEFIDAVRALSALGITDATSAAWKSVTAATMIKTDRTAVTGA
jgi:MoxR-like ATPase